MHGKIFNTIWNISLSLNSLSDPTVKFSSILENVHLMSNLVWMLKNRVVFVLTDVKRPLQ